MAQLTALTQTVGEMLQEIDQVWDSTRTTKIEEPPVSPNDSNNVSNPDDQYLKIIKLDFPTFDGRYDPQLFLEWMQQIDM